MAVQAQYPSNILLLNRNVQEGKSPLVGGDYALKQQQQQQSGGGGGDCFFLDHTNIMPVHHNHNNTENTNNSRKRARDYTTAATAAAAATAAPLQSSDSPLTSMQRPNFIDLTQLNNNTQQKLTTTTTPTNRNMVSTGLGLAFGDQQQQQLPLQHHQQKNSVSPQSSAQSSVLLSLLSDELSSHIKQQRQEIEHFLLAQGEELRRTLAEKRQRQFRTILTAAEESLARRLREREAEVEKAARRNAELEVKASQLSLEAQAWQARARMQENYAATLQMQLQQAIISGTGMAGGHGQGGGAQLQDVGDDWEGGNSTAVMGGGEAEDAESAYIDPDRVVVVNQPSCKACRNRVASVVLLPCRHMCLCTECDAVAQACPVCFSLRCSSIEVFFS